MNRLPVAARFNLPNPRIVSSGRALGGVTAPDDLPPRRSPAAALVKVLALPLLAALAAGGSTPARAEPMAETAATVPYPAAAAAAASRSTAAAVTRHVRRYAEVRALWVIRTALGSAEQVRAMVAQADASGFNTLLVQVRGRGDALYASAHEPRAESLPDDPSFDPLQVAIEEAHARGMAVHAWVNTYLVWGPVDPPRSPEHLVNAHPDWLAVPRSLGRQLYDHDPHTVDYVARLIDYAAANTAKLEGLFTSPSHPEVQQRVLQVWIDLARNYDVDGIHFDYVRFPSPHFDYSRGALERFRTWVEPRLAAHRFSELVAAAEQEPYAMADALPELWNVFRRDSVTSLVRHIYREVKAIRPELVVSAAVLPDQRKAREVRFQAWSAWLADGIIDVAVPMAYTVDSELFHNWIASARVTAGSRERLWAGIGAYLNQVDDTLQQIGYARRERIGGVVVFAYGAAASTPAPPGARAPLEQIGRAAFGAPPVPGAPHDSP